MKIHRNDPCACGSGLKYKKCCLNKPKESPLLSYGWQKIRRTADALNESLLKYASQLFGRKGLEAAWEEFYGFQEYTPEIDKEQMVFIHAFLPWFIFNWCPDQGDELIEYLPEVIAAEDYLMHRNRLDNYELSLIKASLASHYSFYEVIHVVPQQSMVLKDILRGHQITVHEKGASDPLVKSYVMMARIVTLNEDSIISGLYPTPLPPPYLLTFVEFKQHYGQGYFFSDEMLFDLDLEIRTFYIDNVQHMLDNPFPRMQNTDGDELSLQIIHYSLTCTPQHAFDALANLAAGMKKIDLLVDGVYDSNHQLVEISFPWCKIGNSLHPDWENTVYGHINITNSCLTVEVNSVKRAQAVVAEINARLNPHEATYLHTEQEDIQDMLASPHEKTSSPPEDSPEIQAMLKQLSHKHWVSWLDTKIPALNHATPREAAKTADGRERLEALFVDFHQKNLSGLSQIPVDLHFLRQELSMT